MPAYTVLQKPTSSHSITAKLSRRLIPIEISFTEIRGTFCKYIELWQQFTYQLTLFKRVFSMRFFLHMPQAIQAHVVNLRFRNCTSKLEVFQPFLLFDTISFIWKQDIFQTFLLFEHFIYLISKSTVHIDIVSVHCLIGPIIGNFSSRIVTFYPSQLG